MRGSPRADAIQPAGPATRLPPLWVCPVASSEALSAPIRHPFGAGLWVPLRIASRQVWTAGCVMLTETCTFFMPRGGRLECVRAASRDDLVVLRTELEVLRQVRDLLRRPLSESRRAELDAARCRAIPQPGASDLDDLNHLLHDARSPLIEPMTHLIDQEHPDIGAELPMSVIAEEAEHIARDVRRMTENPNSSMASVNLDAAAAPVGAAALSTPDANAPVQEAPSPPEREPVATDHAHAGSAALEADLDKALADAESCLQELSSIVDETAGAPATSAAPAATAALPLPTQEEIVADGAPAATAASSSTMPSPATVDSSSPASCAPLSDPQAFETPATPPPQAGSPSTAVVENTGMTAAAAAHDSDASTPMLPAVCGAETCVTAAPTGNPEPGAQSSAGEEAADATASAAATSDTATQPAPLTSSVDPPAADAPPSAFPGDDAALHALQAVESGLLQLAQTLHGTVSQRWRSAQRAFDDVEQRRAGAERMLREAQMLVEELQRTKERIEIARDDIDICRREAAHFREDARRAKDRAEASAEAACIAADRSARELEGLIQAKSAEHRA